MLAAIQPSVAAAPPGSWAHAMSPPPAPAPPPGTGPAAAAPPHPLQALEAIYCQHQARLLQAAYRIVGNRSDAEDVLQTVFLRLARAAGGGRPATGDDAFAGGDLALRPGPELGGYLHRMTVNAAIDLLRRRRPRAAADAETRLPAATPSPERARSAQELQDLLRASVARLGGRAPEIFALRYWEELSNTEIARRLGIPRVSVAVTLHRARRQLQQTLRRHWGEEL